VVEKLIGEGGFRLEQHVGTIMQILVVALLGWSLKTNVEMTTQMGIVQSELRALQATVAQGTADRYRGTDAARDNGLIWAEFQRRENRISRLEEQMVRCQNYIGTRR